MLCARDPLQSDTLEPGSVPAACARPRQPHFSRLDGLVNLGNHYRDDGAQSGHTTRLTWVVNVVRAVMVACTVRPRVLEASDGIANFSDISTCMSRARHELYPVPKAARVYLTRHPARNSAGNRIRVNSVPTGTTWSLVMDELTVDDSAKSDLIAADYRLLERIGDASFNHHRLPETIGYISLAGAEGRYQRNLANQAAKAALLKPTCFHDSRGCSN